MKTKLDKSTSVITVRIDKDLFEDIEKHREDLGISKADFIRKYLEMSKYISIQNKTIKSLDESELIIIKKGYLRKLIEVMDEKEQMEFGIKIAKYINNIASMEKNSEDLIYKLDLCEHLGFFKKKIDKENYILVSKKFGPKKFIEAFVYKLVNYQKKFEYDKKFTEETVKTQNKIRSMYQKTIQPLIEKSSTHYAFGFAKIKRD
ncbi:hypothetical protein LCGC14_0735450 [marine sediment metagenome]|uniref:Ribbon-helix-helix protein CopG domain-containing protein n=1 Tax=marine sediment metagenome TaxID=412755 RepID=A0A0F9TFJ4_9ZZZZ